MASGTEDQGPDYSDGQLTAFIAIGVISIFLYSFLLIAAIYNSYHFLYRQKRYRIYFITVYYVFAYLVILFRIAIALMLTIVASNYSHYRDEVETGRITLTGLTLEIGATYSKISLGFFQVAAIIILTLQVKQKYDYKIGQISWWLYLATTVWVAAIILGVLIFILVISLCLSSDEKEDPECYADTQTAIVLNATCFGMLSVFLVATIVPLFLTLSSLRKGRLQLSKGVKMLSSVFAVYTFCDVSRTLYDVFVAPSLKFGHLFSGVTLPILWDFVPIAMMFAYHYGNIRTLTKSNGGQVSTSLSQSATENLSQMTTSTDLRAGHQQHHSSGLLSSVRKSPISSKIRDNGPCTKSSLTSDNQSSRDTNSLEDGEDDMFVEPVDSKDYRPKSSLVRDAKALMLREEYRRSVIPTQNVNSNQSLLQMRGGDPNRHMYQTTSTTSPQSRTGSSNIPRTHSNNEPYQGQL